LLGDTGCCLPWSRDAQVSVNPKGNTSGSGSRKLAETSKRAAGRQFTGITTPSPFSFSNMPLVIGAALVCLHFSLALLGVTLPGLTTAGALEALQLSVVFDAAPVE